MKAITFLLFQVLQEVIIWASSRRSRDLKLTADLKTVAITSGVRNELPPPHPPPRSTNNYNKISIRGEKASHTYTPESQEPAHSRGNYLWIGDVKEFFREINTRLSLCSVTPVALFCKSCCLCMKVQVIKVPRCQCESSFVKVLLVLEKMDSVFKCLWSM